MGIEINLHANAHASIEASDDSRQLKMITRKQLLKSNYTYL